ncbi:hypothetical protein SAMN04489806_2052 [Paramicrobacterium humi]|uniref:SipW-cognate class signal peptide n=1 Tax=Paramicrobacterium humi TaxID=640635 RepID=A0A1H4N2X8_9MICO|nr:hypothetical protein [Microbacterium humi]SEB89095.1 hypothetical protein SAMN04489806_2052 [Microbacterium humi]
MRRTAKIGITVSALAVAAVAVAGPGTFAEWSSAASVKETTITTGIQTFTVNGSETPALTIPSATLAAATSDKQTITIDLKGEQQGHRGLYYALPNIAVTAQDAGLVNALQATVYSADPKTTCGATAPKTPLYAGTAAGLAGFSIKPLQIVNSSPHTSTDPKKTSDTGSARYCVTLALPAHYGEYSNTATATATGDAKTQDGKTTTVQVTAHDSWYGQAEPSAAAKNASITFNFTAISVRPGETPSGAAGGTK